MKIKISWPTGIIIAMTALLTTTFALLRGNKQMKMIPIIFGLIAGYVMSIILGVVDLSTVFEGGLFNVPNFQIFFP